MHVTCQGPYTIKERADTHTWRRRTRRREGTPAARAGCPQTAPAAPAAGATCWAPAPGSAPCSPLPGSSSPACACSRAVGSSFNNKCIAQCRILPGHWERVPSQVRTGGCRHARSRLAHFICPCCKPWQMRACHTATSHPSHAPNYCLCSGNGRRWPTVHAVYPLFSAACPTTVLPSHHCSKRQNAIV